MNLEAIADLERNHPGLELVFMESSGDNLSASFSPGAGGHIIYVIDVASGEKSRAKAVRASRGRTCSLEVMERDSRRMRRERPFLFTRLIIDTRSVTPRVGLDEAVIARASRRDERHRHQQSLLVRTEDDFWRLPGDGLWEVVAGRAILLPPSENEHSYIATKLLVLLYSQIQATGRGYVVVTSTVRIPSLPDSPGEFWSRVPDVAVSTHTVRRSYSLGHPLELVIEILSTRRGNVERTEKIEDYARAGIGEYWIVNPLDRIVEVYLLRDGEYQLIRRDPDELLRPQSFAGVAIDPRDIWTALD